MIAKDFVTPKWVKIEDNCIVGDLNVVLPKLIKAWGLEFEPGKEVAGEQSFFEPYFPAARRPLEPDPRTEDFDVGECVKRHSGIVLLLDFGALAPAPAALLRSHVGPTQAPDPTPAVGSSRPLAPFSHSRVHGVPRRRL